MSSTTSTTPAIKKKIKISTDKLAQLTSKSGIQNSTKANNDEDLKPVKILKANGKSLSEILPPVKNVAEAKRTDAAEYKHNADTVRTSIKQNDTKFDEDYPVPAKVLEFDPLQPSIYSNDELNILGVPQHEQKHIQNVKTIHQSAILPSQTEKVARSTAPTSANTSSNKSNFLFSDNQYKKHNVQWLAHRAVVNEDELARKAAEERHGRVSSKRKYGF
jgi:hypothetical protein